MPTHAPVRPPRTLLVLFALAPLAASAAGCRLVSDPTGRGGPRLALPDTGTADGASLTRITVVVDTTAPPDKRAIALTTTAGTLLPGNTSSTTLTPDQSGTAMALLRAPSDSTTVIVTATANGRTEVRQIVYRRAAAERMDVEPAAFTLRAGVAHELAVTARLRRAIGTPSPGTVVTFTAVDTTEAARPVGAFLPVTATSDAGGAAATRFTSADTSMRGPVMIRATTVGGAAVQGAATVRITAP